MGVAEISALLKDYRGSFVLPFAGYNAGRGRVQQWMAQHGDPRDPKVDAVDWVERIPFSETRNYVQRVMENLQVYRTRFGENTTTVEPNLHRVAMIELPPAPAAIEQGAVPLTAELDANEAALVTSRDLAPLEVAGQYPRSPAEHTEAPKIVERVPQIVEEAAQTATNAAQKPGEDAVTADAGAVDAVPAAPPPRATPSVQLASIDLGQRHARERASAVETPSMQPASISLPDPAEGQPKNGASAITMPDACLGSETCIDQYLWSLYERAPKVDTVKKRDKVKVTVTKDGKTRSVSKTVVKLVDEDFAWKDPKAAQKAGMSLQDYVISGMDRGFKLKLYDALRAMDEAGLMPGITSGFRDDYRQSLASGNKAASDSSYHGGSRRGGYGHGVAADLVSVKGGTRAQRLSSSETLWKWIDAHEKGLGVGRPYLDRDP